MSQVIDYDSNREDLLSAKRRHKPSRLLYVISSYDWATFSGQNAADVLVDDQPDNRHFFEKNNVLEVFCTFCAAYIPIPPMPWFCSSSWSFHLWPMAIFFARRRCRRLWSIWMPAGVVGRGTLSRKMLPMW